MLVAVNGFESRSLQDSLFEINGRTRTRTWHLDQVPFPNQMMSTSAPYLRICILLFLSRQFWATGTYCSSSFNDESAESAATSRCFCCSQTLSARTVFFIDSYVGPFTLLFLSFWPLIDIRITFHLLLFLFLVVYCYLLPTSSTVINNNSSF